MDLTNIKIEKFNDFNIVQESVSEDIEKKNKMLKFC